MAKFQRVSLARKKDLNKPDQFMVFLKTCLQFLIDHKVQVISGLSAVIIFVIILIGTRYYFNICENKASMQLEESMTNYKTGLTDNGPKQAFYDVEKDFSALIKKYSNTMSGNMARIYFGDICFSAGEYDRAIKQYKKALKYFNDYPAIKHIIYMCIAYAYESKSDKEAAVTNLEKIIDGNNEFLKDEALFNLGRLYASMGQNTKSISMYETIVSDFADSSYADFAYEQTQRIK
jgi:tetratricopeptide (TPR) repeat protein